MNIFDKIIHQNLQEPAAYFSKYDLDTTIFQFRDVGMPVLRDSIRVQILNDMDQIRKIVPVVRFLIIGDALTKNYQERTSIDVSVEIDPETVDSIATADIMHLLKYLNGRLAADTLHPLYYYLISHELDDTRTEAVYDIINDRWLKTPKSYNPPVEKIISDFQELLGSIDISTGKITRDTVDIEEVRELDSKDKSRLRFYLKQKLTQIEELVKHLSNTSKKTEKIRGLSFDPFDSPEEIHLFGVMNKLPENLISKLLERYYCKKFIRKVEDIMEEGENLMLSNVKKVNSIMGGVWKT